jgi:hypothetical protein
MRTRNLLVIKCVFALVITCSLTWAGNEEVIEERIEELDALNKEVIKQVPGVPENGKINLKAGIIQKDGTVDLTILQKEIDAIETKSSTIKLGSYQQEKTEIEKWDIDHNLEEDEENVSVDKGQ